MSGHTPGPWEIWEGPDYVGGGSDLCIGAGDRWLFNMDHRECKAKLCHWRVCEMENSTMIASTGEACADEACQHETHITEEQRANARLIAAAPDLRNAWDAGRVTIPGPDFLEWVAARCMRYEGLDPDGATEVDFVVRLRAMALAARAAIAKAEGK